MIARTKHGLTLRALLAGLLRFVKVLAWVLWLCLSTTYANAQTEITHRPTLNVQVAQFLDFLDTAISKEDLSDLDWIKKALDLEADPLRSGGTTHFSLKRSSSMGIVVQAQINLLRGDDGSLRRQYAYINLQRSEANCITLDLVKERYPGGALEHRSHFAHDPLEQPVFSYLYHHKKNNNVFIQFRFLFKKCLPVVSVSVTPAANAK